MKELTNESNSSALGTLTPERRKSKTVQAKSYNRYRHCYSAELFVCTGL